MKILIGLLLIFLPFKAYATKDRLLLAAEIYSAKSVYLDNQSGLVIVADYAYRELKKWDRFEVVDSPDKADLIFMFTATDDRSLTTGMANGRPITLVGGPCHATLVVRAPKNRDVALWQDTKGCSWHGASADLVRELKKRMTDH